MSVSTLDVGLAGLLAVAILGILVLLAIRGKLQAAIEQQKGRANELEQMLLDAKRRSSQLAKAAGKWDEEIRTREERIGELAQRMQQMHGELDHARNTATQVESQRFEFDHERKKLTARVEKHKKRHTDLQGEHKQAVAERDELRAQLTQIKEASAISEDVPVGYMNRMKEAENQALQLTREVGNARETEKRLRLEISQQAHKLATLEGQTGSAAEPAAPASSAAPAESNRSWGPPDGAPEPVRDDDPWRGEPASLDDDFDEADGGGAADVSSGQEASPPPAAPPPTEPTPVAAPMVELTDTAKGILEDRFLSAVQKRIVLDMYAQYARQRYDDVSFTSGGARDAREALLADSFLTPRQRDTMMQIYERFTSRRR